VRVEGRNRGRVLAGVEGRNMGRGLAVQDLSVVSLETRVVGQVMQLIHGDG
jgi:hypothetical protein